MAVGAILYWATDFELSGIDMNTVGLIVLIAGMVALVFSLRIAITNAQSHRDGGP
jgi:TRAP-type C4-dicarboxylate transport system permease small subunit